MKRQLLLFAIFTIPYVYNYGQDNLYQYNLKNFREVEVFNETINLQNPKTELLNAVLFYLTNEIRKDKRLEELRYDSKLEQAANLHSSNMVDQNFFDHINPKSKKYRTPEDRARLVGITNPYMAENIAESFVLQYQANKPVFPKGKGVFSYSAGGEAIPAHTYLSLGVSILESWMNSPPHKANILSKKAIQLGCGTAYFSKKDFNEMPSVLSTQNYQLYEPVK